jgi:hypothetical protein
MQLVAAVAAVAAVTAVAAVAAAAATTAAVVILLSQARTTSMVIPDGPCSSATSSFPSKKTA